MCGIFGVISNSKDFSSNNFSSYRRLFHDLSFLSESRGKDSSGICFRDDIKKEFKLLKSNQSISSLIKSKNFKKIINEYSNSFKKNNRFISFGHSRLVTNGSQLDNNNNQPVLKDELIGIHNGIIVNDKELSKKNKISTKYEIDTEVMLSLISKYIKKEKLNTFQAFRKLFKEIEGTISTCVFFEKINQLVLATNNGSIYFATNYTDTLIFASEGQIIKEALKKQESNNFSKLDVFHLKPNTAIFIDLENFKISNIDFSIDKDVSFESKLIDYTTKVKNLNIDGNLANVIDISEIRKRKDYFQLKGILEYNIDKIKKIKRCSKCVLPETFPFISFNDFGVCNYCENYKIKNQTQSLQNLKSLVEPYKRKDGKLDCLVPFSGGRDSTFVLHFVKNVLKLNPIAYTYDWGMVTDLARRNIARVCGKLGVENIIVAADINEKRRNIKLNIEAWLKKPDLGMIPLFMAGDKQFFKHANIIKKQADIDLNIWGINFLENTDFKVGFCGVPPDWNKEMIYSMKVSRQLKLYKHVLKNIFLNPSYINSSVNDTIDSFISRYMNPRKDYYHFFDFYKWNEQEIEKVLFNEYDWETSDDLKSTWRIGDGTASFYNYIYFNVAGFSEFDTFRSNQIREGMLTREDALNLVFEENKPRYDSIRWYLEIIGLDFAKTIEKVNMIKKLY